MEYIKLNTLFTLRLIYNKNGNSAFSKKKSFL